MWHYFGLKFNFSDKHLFAIGRVNRHHSYITSRKVKAYLEAYWKCMFPEDSFSPELETVGVILMHSNV